MDNIKFENLINILIEMRKYFLQSKEYYFHIACLFKDNKKNINILSIGINTYNAINSCKHPTTHAECNALYNLKNRNIGKIDKVSMIILRISSSGKLGNSKPCINCLCTINSFIKKNDFRINKVHYSTEIDITSNSINNLIKESINGNFHTSEFYSKFKFKPKKLNF